MACESVGYIGFVRGSIVGIGYTPHDCYGSFGWWGLEMFHGLDGFGLGGRKYLTRDGGPRWGKRGSVVVGLCGER